MPIRILPKTDKHDEYSRKQRQKQYMDKHGEPGPRRKRLNPDLTAQKRAGKIEDLHERMGGGEKGKPHSSREGRVASGKNRLDRYRKRAQDIMKPKWPKREPMVPLARGGKPEIGPTLGKGKTAGPRAGKGTKDLRDRLKDASKRYGRKSFLEHAGGSEKAKPHSTKEGRIAAGGRKIKRVMAKWPKQPKRTPGEQAPRDPRSPYIKDRVMTPLRAKKAVGGILKKIVSKVKPKPKGKGLGSGVKPSEMHEIIPKKDRKLYLKEKLANPHRRNKESKKLFKTVQGKAEGGRIGLKHGGSVGAAVRGHGAEIK